MEPKSVRVKGYIRPEMNIDGRSVILILATCLSVITTVGNVFSMRMHSRAVQAESRQIVIYGEGCDLDPIAFLTDTERANWKQVTTTQWVWRSPDGKPRGILIPEDVRVSVYLTLDSTPFTFDVPIELRLETEFVSWVCVVNRQIL